MEPTARSLRYHYRVLQHVVLAVLALCWLALVPLAVASSAVTAGANLADRAITAAQRQVLIRPIYYSQPAAQRVWRVR